MEQSVPIDFLAVAFGAFIGGIVLISLFRKLSLNNNVLISRGIPLIGGLAVAISFSFVSFLTFFLHRSLSQEIMGVILTSFIMLIFGLIDDWKELSISAKFAVQIIATALLILFGIRTQIVYIGNLANIIVTFFWVLGISNAFNHLDVIDGLAGGCAIIVSLAFFITALLNNDFNIAILSLALAAATIGFLLYNFPPAKIYIGNSGSHFLGFALAAIALVISYAPLKRKTALLSPVLILGLPIFDTAFLVVMRMLKKSLPFKKSDDHPALRLLAMGYPKKKALLTMLALCIFFSASGVLLSQVSSLLGVGIIILLILASSALTIKMGRAAYK